MKDFPIKELPQIQELPQITAERSAAFWEAMVALGGTPEEVAPHFPDTPEAEIAEKMAKARGNLAHDNRDGDALDEAATNPDYPVTDDAARSSRCPGAPRGYASNWARRVR